MTDNITESQYEKLTAAVYSDPERFIALMEEYTGITAKQYVAYQFFDPAGDYIGDNGDESLLSILADAGIEVVEDGDL